MKKLIPKDKLSKKARKKLAAERRGTWSFSPVTRTVDSKKTYNRKRIPRTRYDDGSGESFSIEVASPQQLIPRPASARHGLSRRNL